MVITKEILDELTAKAKESLRLRMNMDLRNSENDQSQRMLNAIGNHRESRRIKAVQSSQGDRNFYTQYIPSHLLKQIA